MRSALTDRGACVAWQAHMLGRDVLIVVPVVLFAVLGLLSVQQCGVQRGVQSGRAALGARTHRHLVLWEPVDPPIPLLGPSKRHFRVRSQGMPRTLKHIATAGGGSLKREQQ